MPEDWHPDSTVYHIQPDHHPYLHLLTPKSFNNPVARS